MPYKKPEIKKLYYTIGEVADLFNVNTSLIRFWEKEFDIIKPKKNKKGNRLFTEKDVDNFFIIYHLVKERGFTLQGAKEKLRQNPEDTINEIEIVKSLESIKSFLMDLRREKTTAERKYQAGTIQHSCPSATGRHHHIYCFAWNRCTYWHTHRHRIP